MTLRALLVTMAAVAFCCAPGCSPVPTYKEITRRSQLQQQGEARPLIVLTRGGSEFWLARYILTDSTLVGVGEQSDSEAANFVGDIRLDSIEYIYMKEGDFFKSLVFVGLAGTAISVGATAFSNNEGIVAHDVISYPVGKSCPFVYAFDGAGYRFSSETFAGSIFRGGERTVIDRLDALKPVSGSYLLKLTNERKETDYVNELSLVVVDVSEDVEILASADGVFHTLKSPEPPARCTDDQGASVLDAVKSTDGLLWQSGRPGSATGDQLEYRDRLDAVFQLKENRSSVKLLLRGQNTTLPVFTFDQMSALCGEGYARWIYRLEHDPEESNKMRAFMLREGLMHVSVWNGSGWQRAGVFMDPGAELLKEQVLVVPVPPGQQGRFRVRLECTADLWRVDRIAVDESRDLEVACTFVGAERATGSAGKDALSLLAQRDDRYLMTMPGDSMVLSYPVPPTGSGMHRTCFVRAAGYYHHWSSFAGSDNSLEVERIVGTPGYGARKYLPLWFSRGN